MSYSELVGLLIAGAVVLYPLAQVEPEDAAPAAAWSGTSSTGSTAFMCPRVAGG